MMTDRFKIIAMYAIHSGGTKFYQTIEVYDRVSQKEIAINHWGSYTIGAPRAPALCGRQIEVSVVTSAQKQTESKRKDKAKRGYTKWASFNAEGDTQLLTDWFSQPQLRQIAFAVTGQNDITAWLGDFDNMTDDPDLPPPVAEIPLEVKVDLLMDEEWGQF